MSQGLYLQHTVRPPEETCVTAWLQAEEGILSVGTQ